MKRQGEERSLQSPGAELVRDLLVEAGVAAPTAAVDALALHAAEMLRWNRAIRLTAIVEPVEVAVKHIVDSLTLLRFAPFPGRLLDFGSGAGYPGIPLAIYLPGTRIVLVDASEKKCAFLARVRGLLGLENIRIVRGRLSRVERLPIRPVDHVVTRATAAPDAVVPLLSPYLADGGRMLLMTGPGGGEVSYPGTVARTERVGLPRGMGERRIIEWVPAGKE
jgi:16S rRNA (guanine527-N7)-methyltransferase